MKRTVLFVSGVACGAGLTYFADPVRGKRRRAKVRDAAVHSAKVFDRVADAARKDTAHRVKGIFAETKGLFKRGRIDDQVLTDRVRTEVGRFSSHPNVEVMVQNGYVTLLGPVVDREERPVLKAARSVKGIRGVTNRMKTYKPPKGMPTQMSRSRQIDILRSHWAPATRILVGSIGVSVAAAGGKAGGSIGGAIARLAGLALVARATTNKELRRLVGFKAGRRAVDIQKTIWMDVPVDRVYSRWIEYKNFPLFMSRLQEVRDMGKGRSHWVVTGPLGTRLEWDAVITQWIPNKLLAWESEPDSLIQHTGIVRFDSERGRTRVQVRLCYNPPGGAAGHIIATLFGSNPKQEMDEDLLRMKTFIETGKRPHDVVNKAA